MRSLEVPAGFGLLSRLALSIRGPRQPILGTELSAVVASVHCDACYCSGTHCRSVRTRRLVAQIANVIVRSLVDARRGRVDDATAAMRQALDLAAARRYIRSFLDEGPFHRLLLESAASGAADRAFAVRVVAA